MNARYISGPLASPRLTVGLVGAAIVLLVIHGSSRSEGRDDPTAETTAGSYRQQYLKTYLELMQVSLERDKQINEKAPGTIPSALVSLHEQRVIAAREMLAEATEDGQFDDFSPFLMIAKTAANSAESDWRRWVAVREKAPQAKSKLDVESFRLQAELARITYQQGLSLRKAPAAEQNRWISCLLFDELVRINEKVERSALIDSYRVRQVYPIR